MFQIFTALIPSDSFFYTDFEFDTLDAAIQHASEFALDAKLDNYPIRIAVLDTTTDAFVHFAN